MVGSFDRHVHPDEPDRPDRRDPPADQPKAPRETEAQLAERLGLSTLTRRAAYESLYAKAQAQDAPFRERLAREEREKSAGSPGSLTAPADAPAPPKPPIDKPGGPEGKVDAPRDYWTEVPRFFLLWQAIADRWPPRSKQEPGDSRARDGRADDLLVGEKISIREPPISSNVKEIETQNHSKACLMGFGYRLKGEERLKDKIAERLKREPDREPEEIVSTVHDAIRYTFCLEKQSYVSGFGEIKERLESCGYEMYDCKNSWDNSQYKGINTRWITSEGQRFEVQFHTRESFHAKHEVTHQAYEHLRRPGVGVAERRDLMDFQREVSRWIPVPDRVTDIPDYQKKGS